MITLLHNVCCKDVLCWSTGVAVSLPTLSCRFHGCISRDETSKLLGNTEGNYLVRSGLSQAGSYSLSFV